MFLYFVLITMFIAICSKSIIKKKGFSLHKVCMKITKSCSDNSKSKMV